MFTSHRTLITQQLTVKGNSAKISIIVLSGLITSLLSFSVVFLARIDELTRSKLVDRETREASSVAQTA